MNRLLGIDYGSKRIGVALSDESGSIALPHSVMENSGMKDVVKKIVKICEKNNVPRIVVGESKNFSGKDNPIMEEVRTFAHDVRNKGIYVDFHPEFMTSLQAERTPHGSVRPTARLTRQADKNNMLDASAAAIILQSYIDIRSNE